MNKTSEKLLLKKNTSQLYSSTWKYRVMKDLHKLSIKGRLPKFIEGFLFNRKFRVCVDTTFSSVRNQEEGVPRGCILFVTLFNMKINNITKELPPGIDGSLSVDDLICCKSKYIQAIDGKLQIGRKNICRWETINGFKFSETKTKCVPFC